MKYLPLLIFLFACSTNRLATGTETAHTDTIKVLTYNIHHANPPSRKDYIDLDAIAKVISQQQPHFVALQEVDVHTGRSGRDVHEAEALAAKTGMHAYFTKSIPYDGGEYGIAVLSRYPILEGKGYALPSASGSKGEPRALCTVTAALPNGRRIMMASTHLDVLKPDTNRLLQVREISRILGSAGMPVILAGDFNARPGSAAIRLLDSSFTRTCNSCPFTIPVDQPNRTIDFITFAPGNAFRVLRHDVIPERYASDHLPVTATLIVND
ncbi:endonuclease/exonuclease/phosphatase family protein [uncultured Chitinophaga sp.]|uniref:endonuclease/exonuclease/phosphatase family protein n=1 Tax=uncultured Chitinophaga sp. TaxID=339340 RepID=UPI00260D4294|nr:endonuclease/exonuclease/phosphatase family protein [uncultured Chitinophaga sp.]